MFVGPRMEQELDAEEKQQRRRSAVAQAVLNDKYSNAVVNALCQALPELRVTEQQQQLAPAGQAEADVWQSIRVYETGEPAISAGVIRRMEVQKGGGVSVFFSGMKKAGDWAGCNATHEAFEAYYKWFADERFGGDLEPVHEMVACAGGKRVNAGTNSTADCSQTVAFCLQDHDVDRVCIARRGARRAFYKTPTDLARVLDDSRLPETLRKLLSTATVVSFPSWLDVCQAIVCGTVCRGNQWPVQDPQLHTDWCTRFDTRGCNGPTVMPLMRDPQSTLRVRIGTAYSVFNVLGFAFQFCTLVLFGMATFGVSVGNPQSGGDAWRVRINRHGDVAAGHSWLGKRKRDETTVDETTVHGQPLKVQKFAMSASGAVVFEARKKQRTLRISSSDAPDESAQIGDPPPRRTLFRRQAATSALLTQLAQPPTAQPKRRGSTQRWSTTSSLIPGDVSSPAAARCRRTRPRRLCTGRSTPRRASMRSSAARTAAG